MLVPHYDVVVIGSGPAGIAASITCVQKGLSVLMISNYKKKVKFIPLKAFILVY